MKLLCAMGCAALLLAGRATSAASSASPAAGAKGFRSAVLVDAESGQILFEQEAHLKTPPASMTKMMLMLLVLERVQAGKLGWDDPIAVSARAASMGGSQVFLKPGEVFPLKEMMAAIVVHSANDAAVAVAETISGSVDAFVAAMNKRAGELGMKETTYATVHGLPPEKGQAGDVSSAADMGRVATEVLRHPEILQWSSLKETTFRGGSMVLTNTNRLLREVPWVDGLKTGYIRESGFNVTATGRRDGLRLIAVIMGAAEKPTCFREALVLLNRGFAEYYSQTAVKEGDPIASDVPIKNGRPRFVRIVAGRTLSVLAKRGEKRQFALQLALNSNLEAPLRARQQVGELVVRDGTNVVGTVPALAVDTIEKATMWESLF